MSRKKKIGLGILGAVVALVIIALVAPTSEPEPFPPPEGYSSWEAYYEETGQSPATTTPPETTESAPPSEPAITPSEQAYTITIADHSSKASEALYELSALMSNPLIGDDEWTLNVAVQLVTIQALYDEAIEINPPSSMTNIHYKYVQAMKHFESATQLIAQGIDELDANLINQATAEMNLGGQLIDEATELIEEFTMTHSQ